MAVIFPFTLRTAMAARIATPPYLLCVSDILPGALVGRHAVWQFVA